jgi:hypothetical protein
MHRADEVMAGPVDAKLVVRAQGGDQAAFADADVEVWDPSAESFTLAGTLAQGRSDDTDTLLDDGCVLFAGGWVIAGGDPAVVERVVATPAGILTGASPAADD